MREWDLLRHTTKSLRGTSKGGVVGREVDLMGRERSTATKPFEDE